ncbi:MAG: SigF/SigG family RNA polymerase sporulation sigma factor [Defluviitaleaceae bacterium]|nr:SigF/SigG family RNA polymerase sporulation sigma factor [Defluviitaleaceae bacterium]MCL2835306.1 SigF/SigG family RNA polymerase sporulation sigma factor [Defluviitaleaceae bacterium]
MNTDDTFELVRMAQAGDLEAKESLVKRNAGLIWSIARRFSGRGCDLDDLYQIGAIGLIKCIDKFDTEYGVKFSTYAVPMILGEIKRFLRDDGIIKVSRPLKEMAMKARYTHLMLQQKLGKPPTIDELAAAMETDSEELVLAMESGFEIESLHSVIGQGDGSPIYLIDRLGSDSGGDDNMVDIIALKQIISELDKKDRTVIVMRYFQDKTQTEVARAIGVSQVQISRIEKRVLGMIREKMSVR